MRSNNEITYKNSIIIEIGLCADEGYSMACGVCITSIFESNPDSKFRVHILTNGFSEETEKRLKKTAEKYDQVIKIYHIDSKSLSTLPTLRHYSLMIYARLLFPYILENSINKLLYLDCDIIVTGDIRDLWNSVFDGNACLAIPDMHADDMKHHNKLEIYNNTYVNSGVILMNLLDWRENDWGRICIEYVSKYPQRCVLPDQDAINAVLSDRMGFVDFKYNFTVPTFYGEFKELRLHKKWWNTLKEAQKNPVIIHYVSENKPWHKEYTHYSNKFFINIKKISFWRDYKVRYRNSGLRLIKYFAVEVVKKLIKFFK